MNDSIKIDVDLSDIEVEYDETADREFECIGNMIEEATNQGLLVEVIWSFGQARSSGDSINEAAFFALNDWDI